MATRIADNQLPVQPVTIQPEICTALVKKFKRGMITLPQMVSRLNAAKDALAQSKDSQQPEIQAKDSQQPEIQAKQPLYSNMVVNYQAAIAKCLKKG